MEIVREFVEKLDSGGVLEPGEVETCAERFATGLFDPGDAAALLEHLASRPYSGTLLAGFASVFRRHATEVPAVNQRNLVDTCGTGGGSPSWNLSTAATLIVAGAGGRVAKHGNRAVSSKVGSADVLEALGIRLEADPVVTLQACGIGFFFAPRFHPAFRHVGPLRKSLPFRTVFNCLGPLLNPVHVKRQVIGVWEPALVAPLTDALRILGAARGLVVCGEDGLDEVSPTGRTWAGVVRGGGEPNWLTLDRFGLEPVSIDALAPSDTAEGNAALVRHAISDGTSDAFRVVLPSAAAAIWTAGLAEDLREAVGQATEAVRSGRAVDKLQAWREATNNS